MRAIIPSTNIKVFARSIHSLSKIGEELYVEAEPEKGLSLRTVNSSRSAFACFVFPTTFFVQFNCSDEVVENGSVDKSLAQSARGQSSNHSSDVEENGDDLKCKIGMKSCLQVFKSISTLEKVVDKCCIELKPAEDRLIIKLYCKHGIVKTHNLAFIECETLQAVFSKQHCPNVLKVNTRVLSDVVSQFSAGQEELSLVVDQQRVIIRSYVDDYSGEDRLKSIHTELNLSAEEFENYSISLDTEITFCLKELKAVLMFTEPAELAISMHFETAGKPIVLSVSTDLIFEANFVLATMADQSSATQQQPRQQQQNSTPAVQPSGSKKETRKKEMTKKSSNAEVQKENRLISSDCFDKQDSFLKDNTKSDKQPISLLNNEKRAVGESGSLASSCDRVESSDRSADLIDSTGGVACADDTTEIMDVSLVGTLHRSIASHLHVTPMEGIVKGNSIESPVIPLLAPPVSFSKSQANDAANFTCNISVAGVTNSISQSNASNFAAAAISANSTISANSAKAAVSVKPANPATTVSTNSTTAKDLATNTSVFSNHNKLEKSKAPLLPQQKSNLFSSFDSSDGSDEDDNGTVQSKNSKDVIVGTPPTKKFCMSFIGLSQASATGNPASHSTSRVDQQPSVVLAQDSDED